jgi:TP901 family phage tail tape measure protein
MADYTARSSVILNGKQAEDQLAKLEKRSKSLREEMKKLRQANDLSGFKQKEKELRQVNKEMRQMKKEAFSVQKVLKNLSGASFKEISTAARKASAELKTMRQTDPGFKQKTQQVTLLNEKLRQLNAQTRTQQGLMSRMAEGFNKYSAMIMGYIAVFAGIVMGIKRMKGTIDDFEESITNVYTLLDEADYQQFKPLLDKGSVDLLRQYGLEIKDINKALFDTISAGIPAGESIQFMKEAAILAKGGVTSLSISVDGMTSILNAYGLAVDDANQISSAFFTAQKYGKTTVQALAQSIGATVPIASQAGVSYQELLSAVSAMTTRGISTDMAMTSMKNALQSVLKPGTAAEKVLRKLGVPIGATEVRAKGLAYTLERLNEAMEKNPDLVAKAIPNIRGMTAVSALSGRGLEKYHQILEQVNKDYGEGSSLMNAYTLQMETNVQKRQAAIGKRKASILELSDTLNPFFTSMIRLSTWSTRALLKSVKFIIENKKAVLTLATAFVTYRVALMLANVDLQKNIILTKAKVLWNKTYTASTYVVAAAQAVFTGNLKRANVAMKMFNKTAKLNPFVLLAAVIAAAGMALYQYTKKTKELSAAQKAFNDVETTAQQNIVERKLKVEELLKTARNEKLSLHERQKALEELNKISPKYFGNLSLEKINSEEATTATENYTKALLKQARVQAAREKLVELEKERIKTVMDGSDKELTFWQKARSNGLAYAAGLDVISQGVKANAKMENYRKENAEQATKTYEKQKEVLLGLIEANETNAGIETEPWVDPFEFSELEDSADNAAEKLTEFLNQSLDKQRDAINAYFHNAGKGAFEAFLAAIEKSARTRDVNVALKFQEDEKEAEDPVLAYAMQKYSESIDFKLALNESMYQSGLIGEQQYQDQLTAITQKAENERYEIKRENIARMQDLANLSTSFVTALMDMELEKAGDNEKKKKEIKKKYADLNFAVTAAQIIADTAGAIMEGYRQLGPVAGTVAAVLLGATGLVQLGIANAQRQKAKAFAKGKYPVEADDGKTYNAKYAGRPKTGFYDGPQFGIFNEVPNQPEMVIDGVTTRDIRLNYPEILEAIYAVRDGIMPRFARGKYPDNFTSAGAVPANVGMQSTPTMASPDIDKFDRAIDKLMTWEPEVSLVMTDVAKRLERLEKINEQSKLK